jgi:hypothetical protein
MHNRFVRRLEDWLSFTLREKILHSGPDGRLYFIGANDLATCLADFILGEVTQEPAFAWSRCGIEDVTDPAICELTALSSETVAAGFIGASVELAKWEGPEAIAFLCVHGVPEDDAREVSEAVADAMEKLCARGQAMIGELDRRHGAIAEAELQAVR